MRKHGFTLTRKTEFWMHRRRGCSDISLTEEIDSGKITKFILQGRGVISEDDGSFIGVGDYDSESGCYKIPLHIHGKNYLSGSDFAAIHSSKNVCSNSATQSDQYMFIPANNSSGVTLIDESLIKFKENTAYTIAFSVKFMTSTKPRDLKISINYTDGTSYTPTYDSYAKEFTECISTDPEKTVKEIVSYIGDKQVTIYLMSKFGIYQGVHTSHADVHESYIGERYEILLNSPLFAIDYSRDEVDLLRGRITRKIKTQTIGSEAEINKTDEEGIFAITLDKPARPGSRIISPKPTLTEDSGEGICLSENGSEILFKPSTNLTEISEVKEYLSGAEFAIAYVLNEPETEYISPYLPATEGKAYVDILTKVSPKKFFIEYH